MFSGVRVWEMLLRTEARYASTWGGRLRFRGSMGRVGWREEVRVEDREEAIEVTADMFAT